ncbi:hypothetical protein [Streptosporangium sp. NPDC051022]|uniref:hypothetical protein n=1 Tax=Streptosporangium sp. NPDC051022 TaxID=3155752 RepID=UPI00342CC77E
MIRDWFRTRTGLVRAIDRLRDRLAEADEFLTEAREEAADLEIKCGELRRHLAAEQLARQTAESRSVWRPAPVGGDRATVLQLQATVQALEARLARLQEANMARDTGVVHVP